MSGDVSGGDKGQIKFHFTEFAQAPKIPGMKGGLAGAMLAEFEKILETFKKSLEGNAKEGKELTKLATNLVTLAQALNSVTSTEEKPSEIISNVDSSIEQVKKDMAPFKKSPYYSVLVGALNRIEEMFKGGSVIGEIRQLDQDVTAVIKWLQKHEHGKISNDAKKKYEQLIRSIAGDLEVLKKLEKTWPTGILGPCPKIIGEVYKRAERVLKFSWNDKKKAIAELTDFVNWSKANSHLNITPEQVVRVLQAMAQNNAEGQQLRKDLPGIWTTYDEAQGSVRQMQAQAGTMGNETVSNIRAKMMAIQKLTALLSKDLNVPITAIDQSITRVFR